MKYRIEEKKKLMAKIEVPSKAGGEKKSGQASGSNTAQTDNRILQNNVLMNEANTLLDNVHL